MADLPVKRACYYAGLLPVIMNNLRNVSTSTDVQAGEKLATLSCLAKIDQILGNLQLSGTDWAFTGSTISGLSYGEGLGNQISTTAWQILTSNGDYIHIFTPDVNSVWPTSSSQLQSLLYTTQTIKLDYYLADPYSKFQAFTNSGASAAVNKVIKETATSAAGNVSAALVTATTDNAWGLVFCGPLGQSGAIATSASGIALRGGFLNSVPAFGAVGALYFNATADLTTISGSGQVGTIAVDAGGGNPALLKFKIDF